jgi:hypothetical protein
MARPSRLGDPARVLPHGVDEVDVAVGEHPLQLQAVADRLWTPARARCSRRRGRSSPRAAHRAKIAANEAIASW